MPRCCDCLHAKVCQGARSWQCAKGHLGGAFAPTQPEDVDIAARLTVNLFRDRKCVDFESMD